MYDMKNLTKLKKLGELAPEAFKGFAAFDEAAFKGGAIPLKYKELMAVAVALTTQCPYCIEIHAKKASNFKITCEKILDVQISALPSDMRHRVVRNDRTVRVPHPPCADVVGSTSAVV